MPAQKALHMQAKELISKPHIRGKERGASYFCAPPFNDIILFFFKLSMGGVVGEARKETKVMCRELSVFFKTHIFPQHSQPEHTI